MSCSVGEWGERSFLLELKPRAELASLFVDYPETTEDDKEDDDDTTSPPIIRVGADFVEMRQPASTPLQARIEQLALTPQSVCAPTWADNRRLFMCKVHAEARHMPIVPKTYHRLAEDVALSNATQEWAESVSGALHIHCKQCNNTLVDANEGGEISLGWLPSDDWLTTSQSADFYCRDTCGAACDPSRHAGHSHGSTVGEKPAHSDWTAHKHRALLAHSFTLLHTESLLSGSVVLDGKMVNCAGCDAQIGQQQKNEREMVHLHHTVCEMRMGDKVYMNDRFSCVEQFFAQLILATCESQSSLKLVIRGYDRTPHLLLWLLDSYVVLAGGGLSEEKDGQGEKEEEGEKATTPNKGGGSKKTKGSVSPKQRSQSPIEKPKCDVATPFPALKMLYKVFDAKSAASDPRANGEDSSVGLIDVPSGCAVQLVESLLRSSHALPPACRSVGQFYVGFLQLSHHI